MSCTNCPYVATLDAADELLDGVADIHSAPEAARGAIEVCRRSMKTVQALLACDGPVADKDGQRVCPLSRSIVDAYMLATGPANAASWAFAPERLLGHSQEHKTPGQFL
jgi:hypothetical protein